MFYYLVFLLILYFYTVKSFFVISYIDDFKVCNYDSLIPGMRYFNYKYWLVYVDRFRRHDIIHQSEIIFLLGAKNTNNYITNN